MFWSMTIDPLGILIQVALYMSLLSDFPDVRIFCPYSLMST